MGLVEVAGSLSGSRFTTRGYEFLSQLEKYQSSCSVRAVSGQWVKDLLRLKVHEVTGKRR
jgi:hypothetical protein